MLKNFVRNSQVLSLCFSVCLPNQKAIGAAFGHEQERDIVPLQTQQVSTPTLLTQSTLSSEQHSVCSSEGRFIKSTKMSRLQLAVDHMQSALKETQELKEKIKTNFSCCLIDHDPNTPDSSVVERMGASLDLPKTQLLEKEKTLEDLIEKIKQFVARSSKILQTIHDFQEKSEYMQVFKKQEAAVKNLEKMTDVLVYHIPYMECELGAILLSLDKTSRLKTLVKRVSKKVDGSDPNLEGALRALQAMTYIQSNDSKRVADLIALESQGDVDILLLRAEHLTKANHFEEALEILRSNHTLFQKEIDSQKIRLQEASILVQMHLFTEDEAYIDQALGILRQIKPVSNEIRLRISEALALKFDSPEAFIEAVNNWLDVLKAPDDRKQADEVEQRLSFILASERFLYLERGLFETCLSLIVPSLESKVQSATASDQEQLTLGILYKNTGQYAKALKIFSPLSKMKNSHASFFMGIIGLQLKDYKKAIQMLVASFKQGSSHSRLFLAQFMEKQGRNELALKLYRSAAYRGGFNVEESIKRLNACIEGQKLTEKEEENDNELRIIGIEMASPSISSLLPSKRKETLAHRLRQQEAQKSRKDEGNIQSSSNAAEEENRDENLNQDLDMLLQGFEGDVWDRIKRLGYVKFTELKEAFLKLEQTSASGEESTSSSSSNPLQIYYQETNEGFKIKFLHPTRGVAMCNFHRPHLSRDAYVHFDSLKNLRRTLQDIGL